MAADLHIHALVDPCTPDDIRRVLGPRTSGPGIDNSAHDAAMERVCNTPQFWVCEVSWLKAALLGDRETFVPDVAEQVTEAIGSRLPVLDDAMVGRLTVAMFGEATQNSTSYSTVDAAKLGEWAAWCEQNKGRRLFHVSW